MARDLQLCYGGRPAVRRTSKRGLTYKQGPFPYAIKVTRANAGALRRQR
jgi:hypothetical protein